MEVRWFFVNCTPREPSIPMIRGLNWSPQAACPIVRDIYSSVGHSHIRIRIDYIWCFMGKTIFWSTRLSFPYSSPAHT